MKFILGILIQHVSNLIGRQILGEVAFHGSGNGKGKAVAESSGEPSSVTCGSSNTYVVTTGGLFV